MTDREKLIELLEDSPALDAMEGYEWGGYALGADHLIANDVVPVVRCKDCEHWAYTTDGMGDCQNPRFSIPGCVDPTMYANDFCSCGERRCNNAAD